MRHEKDNYGGETKKQARFRVYRFVASAAPGPLMHLTGSKLYDINVAEVLGFPFGNQILVEKDPAVNAWLTQALRQGFPGQKPLARMKCSLSEASRRLGPGFTKAASLDFTGKLDNFGVEGVLHQVGEFCSSGVLEEGPLAVWFPFGHDHEIAMRVGNANREKRIAMRYRILEDHLRRNLLLNSIPRVATPVDYFDYLNDRTGNTVLVALYQIAKKGERR